MKRIGIVGVGRMGANMARRLREVGYPVTAVYDVRADAANTLAVELGCEACDTLACVTALADVVITVVTDDRAQLQIYTNKRDNLLIGAAGKIFVNCATITPATHIKVERIAQKARAATLECCMASSINQARAGTLYLMCAGRRPVFDKVRPILQKLSDNGKLLRYVGAAGQAAKTKALVNMVMNINTAGLAEGLGLGAALGLDLKMLLKIFSQTGANSRVLTTDGEDMVNREHACFFSAAHAAKDSRIALALAKQMRLNLPLEAATYKQYKKMMQVGLGELDKSGIAELTFKGRGSRKASKRRRR
jgi:3-hydroxyisobutyrate dehydrogenase